MAKKVNITKEMSIQEVVVDHPETVEVFAKYGMGCIGCAAARFENIGQAAQAHGIDIKKLLDDLNKALKKKKN